MTENGRKPLGPY